MIKTFIKNSSILTAYSFISIPLGYAVRLLYANNLSISEFGLFYALLNFFGFVSVFNDFGFSETQRYFLPKYLAKKEYNKVKGAIIASFLTKIGYTLVVSIALFFLANFFSRNFFRIPEAATALRLMILYWFLSGLLTNIGDIFFAYKDAAVYGSTEIVRLTLTLCSIAVFFAVLPHQKLYGVIWGWIAVYSVMVTAYILIFIRKHGIVLLAKPYPLRSIYKEFIPFLIPTAIQSGIVTVLNNSTVMILTFFRGVEAVALYNIAQPIANVLLLFVLPVAALLQPITIEFDVNKEHHKIRHILHIILNLGVFILIPFVLLLNLYSFNVIILLFKSVYVQASVLLKIAAFQIFFVIISNFLSTIIAGFGIPKERAKIYGIASLINIILSILFIFYWGTTGALVAVTITYAYMLISWIKLIRTKLDFSIPWGNYLKMSILAIIFIGVHLYMGPLFHISNIYLKISIISTVSLILYFSLGIYLFKIVDISFVRKLL